MDNNQSPLSVSETGSCSTPYTTETRKRKRSVPASQPPREYGLMRDTGEHDAARFVGSGSGIHYIRAVYLRLARKSASRSHHAATANVNTLVPGEDDQLRKSASDTFDSGKPFWKPNEVLLTPVAADLTPSFENLVDWSKSFFESWHPILPFLHGPDVLQIFEKTSSEGVGSLSSLDYTVLRSVLSISLADGRQGPQLTKPIPSNLVFNSVEEAVSSSQFALTQPASIQVTQAALSIQLFLTSMLCLNAASRLGGLIVRMAFHLGLHRCPARFGGFTPEGVSIRRRVLWCIYILERFLCQSLGLPLDIRDDDLDVCYPGEERHGGNHASAEGDDRLRLLTLVAKHARIRGLILELRNKSIQQRQDTAEKTSAVQTELAKWANEIQDIEDEEDDNDLAGDSEVTPRPKLSPSHHLMLLILKHESTICLNRPGLASEPSSPSYSSAFQSCISASKSICSLFHGHKNQHRLSTNEPETRLGVPLLWPSFTWSVWISTFVLLHAAFENQVPLNRALRHAVTAKSVLGHLAHRDTSWPEYCMEAIDEIISTVQDLSRSPSAFRPISVVRPSNRVRIESGISQSPHQDQHGTSWPNKPTNAHQNSFIGAPSFGHNRDSTTQDGITTGSNAEAETTSQAPIPSSELGPSFRIASMDQGRSLQTQNGAVADTKYIASTPSINRFYLPNLQAPSGNDTALETPEGAGPTGPLEGQESLLWYDQLFASSFNAIENPFLAAAELDISLDATWNHWR